MAITRATTKRNRIDIQHFRRQHGQNAVAVINLLFLNFTSLRMGYCTPNTLGRAPPTLPGAARCCGHISVCAGSGTLIHNFLPHSLQRLGPEPHPPVEKNGYFSSSKAQPLTARTLHHRTDRLRDGDPLRGGTSGG